MRLAPWLPASLLPASLLLACLPLEDLSSYSSGRGTQTSEVASNLPLDAGAPDPSAATSDGGADASSPAGPSPGDAGVTPGADAGEGAADAGDALDAGLLADAAP